MPFNASRHRLCHSVGQTIRQRRISSQVLDIALVFAISTQTVDNFVDKRLLTSRKASIEAGFNKMHVSQAKTNPCKINDLHTQRSESKRRREHIPTNLRGGG
jgi:hypothetical protein